MNIDKVKESEVARINTMIENLRSIVKAILIAEKKVMKGGNPFIQNIKRKLKLPNSSSIEEVANKLIKGIKEEAKKEADLMRRQQHEYLIKCEDYQEDSNGCYIYMELAHEDLETFI